MSCVRPIHTRRSFVPQRPRDPAHWDLIKGAAAASTVPVIANGDVFAHADFQRIRDETGAQAAMCARGAMWNASIFRRCVAADEGRCGGGSESRSRWPGPKRAWAFVKHAGGFCRR